MERRLVRIEDKVDQLVEGLTRVVRIEERQSNIQAVLQQIDARHEDHESRIKWLEIKNASNGIKIGFGERLFWILAALALGALGLWKQ